MISPAATVVVLLGCLSLQAPSPAQGEIQFWRKHLGDSQAVLRAYFAREVESVAAANRLAKQTAAAWKESRAERQRELREMLGLDPLPPRTDLRVQVTGTLTDAKLGITVDKLHFQSMPGLYVTANLYRPLAAKDASTDGERRRPAVLYLCGHGKEKHGGYSYGNKTHYLHHPTWFAQNGYVCLIIDTLQLGEIEGQHHGTYRLNQWWWVRRGYTPAGVEAWNSMRALDYLSSLEDVDPKRIGVTGRSGGGVGTWYLAALDDRPAALVPVAGLTDLQNHVITGCIEGHCDCNYFLNLYRWDFNTVAALAAPRPLLLSNSDKDTIFPLDGVIRLHTELKTAYGFYGETERLGLSITEGPHADTQDLRVPAFRWMERFLTGDAKAVVQPVERPFRVQQLRVFDGFPDDARNKTIQKDFVAAAAPRDADEDIAVWRDRTLQRLFASTFRSARVPLDARLEEVQRLAIDGLLCRDFVLHTGDVFRLPMRLWTRDGTTVPSQLSVSVANDLSERPQTAPQLREGQALAVVVPRGLGPTAWPVAAREANHIRRRFLVLGRTLAQTRIHDLRAAVRALRHLPAGRAKQVVLRGSDALAEVALFAAILEPSVAAVHVSGFAAGTVERLALPGLAKVVHDDDIPALVHPRRVRVDS